MRKGRTGPAPPLPFIIMKSDFEHAKVRLVPENNPARIDREDLGLLSEQSFALPVARLAAWAIPLSFV